jgi:hypothetical protein
MPPFQYSRTAAISAALLTAWMLPALAQQAPVEGASASMDEVQGRVQEPAASEVQDQKVEDQKAPDQKASDQPAADQPAAKKSKKPKKPYGGGTPIDVIVNNKMWETPPEPKEFVLQNRRPVDELNYEPTVGIDPERPKTRSKDELNGLKSELDDAASHNLQAVNGKKKAGSPPAKKAKTKTAKTATDKATAGTDKTN